jgi:hypothetical protein
VPSHESIIILVKVLLLIQIAVGLSVRNVQVVLRGRIVKLSFIGSFSLGNHTRHNTSDMLREQFWGYDGMRRVSCGTPRACLRIPDLSSTKRRNGQQAARTADLNKPFPREGTLEAHDESEVRGHKRCRNQAISGSSLWSIKSRFHGYFPCIIEFAQLNLQFSSSELSSFPSMRTVALSKTHAAHCERLADCITSFSPC